MSEVLVNPYRFAGDAAMYSDDFTSYTSGTGGVTWSQDGTQITIDGNIPAVVGDGVDGTVLERLYKVLPETLDNSKWLCDFNIKYSVIGNAGTEGLQMWFTSTDGEIKETDMDAVGFDTYGQGGAPQRNVRISSKNGSVDGYGTSFSPALNTQYYARMIRDDSAFTLTYYNDEERTDPFGAASLTLVGTIENMGYVQISSWVTTGSSQSYEVAALRVYNGVTSI